MNVPAALQQALLHNLLQSALQWPALHSPPPPPQPTVVAPLVLPVTMAPAMPKRRFEQPPRTTGWKRPLSERSFICRKNSDEE
ncbi:unnamed protein product [Heligmosomoides polygyrus]|uniref:Secreted protein n=1 Tax=Heligmosomoides polygyrus TaxID=6339 RepID=A0A183FUL4_HELPZ|nr:unnamed protein product [Heligmosomoides polygyrus]